MYTVMIVDDYEVFRQGLRDMPVWGDESGFLVTEEASNGLEAIKKLRKNPVHLLLTDIRMPLMDGLELIETAVGQSLCDCIVIMSQFSDFEYARKGLSSGAMDYLLKPVNQDELQKVLARAAVTINESRKTQTKITYFEDMLNKSADGFSPDKELDHLLTLIGEGSRSAQDAASDLVDFTYSELDLDSIRTAQVLNRVLKKLVESVSSEFTWLGNFLPLHDLKLGDLSSLGDICALRESFVKNVDTLVSIIRKYELDIENDSMVRMACRTILENIDTDITVSELSNKLFITRTYLSQVFKDKTGMTLVKYLTDVKIDRAKFLISNGSRSNEIAEILGYKDDEYFKKLFKKATGMTMGEFKNQTLG